MHKRRLYNLTVIFVVDTLLCGYCAYLIHLAVERRLLLLGIGATLIALVVGLVMMSAVSRA